MQSAHPDEARAAFDCSFEGDTVCSDQLPMGIRAITHLIGPPIRFITCYYPHYRAFYHGYITVATPFAHPTQSQTTNALLTSRLATLDASFSGRSTVSRGFAW